MSQEPEIVTRFRALLDQSTTEELEALAYKSPAVHFALYMEIKDKTAAWIRPTPNVLQLRISEVIETIQELDPSIKVRIVGVKPRRAGLSTFSLFCGYHECQRRAIEGITIADCKDNSEMLVGRLGEFTSHDSFPWENPLVRNPAGEFEWSNGSRWTIDTAENPDAGVGGTRQFGHFSECSKYPQTEKKNDKKTMAAVLPSLNGEGTIAIAESTPEGAQGWFYDTFDEGMWLDDFLKRYEQGFRPEQVWIKVFAAWWEFDEYRRSNPVSEVERMEIDRTLSDIEREEREKYGLTYEQIAWRRDTIAGECNGDPKVFAFYYPSDPVTCWIASGSPRFDIAKLIDWKRRAKEVPFDSGYLAKQEGSKRVTFSHSYDGTGEIKIWEMPLEGMAYVVCCDPATGESQTVGADPDRTSIGVWRQKYYDPAIGKTMRAKLVARVRGPFFGDDDIAAGHIDRLSSFYGRCICGLEVNQGLQVLRCLRDAGVPLFKRIVESHKTKSKEEQWGFKLTDQNQRRMIIEGLAAAIRNDEIEILCPDMIDELMKFVTKPNGRSEAASGAHDDDVMMAGMAWEVLPSATVYARTVRNPVDPPDMVKPGSKRQGWRTVSNVKQGW